MNNTYMECTTQCYYVCTTNILQSRVVYISSSISLFLQVSLPVDITQRRGHSAIVFGCEPSFRVVVLFGGYDGVTYFSETTLLLLGESIT